MYKKKYFEAIERQKDKERKEIEMAKRERKNMKKKIKKKHSKAINKYSFYIKPCF